MEGSGESEEQSSSPAVENHRNKMDDHMPTRWTNEKHRNYLNSVEASFVNDLNTVDHLSKNFNGWLSRIRKQNHSSLSAYSAKSIIYGQLKVQRLGHWEKVKFERAKKLVEIENQHCLESASRWIQHFRPQSNQSDNICESTKGKAIDVTPINQVDCDELAIRGACLASPRNEREGDSSKQNPDSPTLYREDSSDGYRDESGQNFAEEESQEREEFSTSCYSRKERESSSDSVNKQVMWIPENK